MSNPVPGDAALIEARQRLPDPRAEGARCWLRESVHGGAREVAEVLETIPMTDVPFDRLVQDLADRLGWSETRARHEVEQCAGEMNDSGDYSPDHGTFTGEAGDRIIRIMYQLPS